MKTATILIKLSLVTLALLVISTIATNSALDGIYVPIGSCPTSSCCCSNPAYPTSITTSQVTDEIIVESEFLGNRECGGYQRIAAVFNVIDSSSAIWIMPITNTKWQLKWSSTFDVIQLQQLDPLTGTIDVGCLNQLKRFSILGNAADDHLTLEMLPTPSEILSTTGRTSAKLVSDDGSHAILIDMDQIGRSQRFGFAVRIDPTSTTSPTPILEAVTAFYISPTTLQATTAVMGTPKVKHCRPDSTRLSSSSKWTCEIPIPAQTSARIAFSYRLSTKRGQGIPSKTIGVQNNQNVAPTTFFLADGDEIDYETYAYLDRFVPADHTPPIETGTTVPIGGNGTSPPPPKTTPTTPKPTPPADYRVLLSGDWKSTGSCKSGSSCCCISPSKDVAISVYLPEEAKTKKIDVDGIDPKNENQIVVVGYLDSHSSCFGIKELLGTCTLNPTSMQGKCSMQNGISSTAKFNKEKGEISIENSMFEDCISTAKPLVDKR